MHHAACTLFIVSVHHTRAGSRVIPGPGGRGKRDQARVPECPSQPKLMPPRLRCRVHVHCGRTVAQGSGSQGTGCTSDPRGRARGGRREGAGAEPRGHPAGLVTCVSCRPPFPEDAPETDRATLPEASAPLPRSHHHASRGNDLSSTQQAALWGSLHPYETSTVRNSTKELGRQRRQPLH